MANKTAFRLDLGRMAARTAELDPKVRDAVSVAWAETADFATAYAKTNAPWTDRTGNARAGLHTDVSHSRNQWQMIVAHLVSYGIWLEVANSGRYQIILPTMQEAMRRMQRHLNGMMGDIR